MRLINPLSTFPGVCIIHALQTQLLLQRALELYESHCDPDSVEVANALCELAHLYTLMKKYRYCRQWYHVSIRYYSVVIVVLLNVFITKLWKSMSTSLRNIQIKRFTYVLLNISYNIFFIHNDIGP